MITKSKEIEVSETKVMCDGVDSKQSRGHPAVYLFIDEKGYVECPYCSRIFIYKEPAI